MNNKGFAVSGILYSILVLFLVILALFLFSTKGKKTILDNLKQDTINSIDGIDKKKMRIHAREVEYNKNGSENVQEALDDLYEMIN